MAKLTLTDLKGIVQTELDVQRIAQDAPYKVETEDITGMIEKIGKQYTLTSSFADKLPELTGEYFAYGAQIEEWFVNMQLPIPADLTGANNMAPSHPTFEEVSYSYPLTPFIHKTTTTTERMKYAMLGESEFSEVTANIIKNLYDAKSIYTYSLKKGLIGRMIDRIKDSTEGNPNMVTVLPQPTNTVEIEAFAKLVKNNVEAFTDLITEDYNLRKVPARSDDLVLFVKPGLRSVIDVDLLAGAFNQGRAEIPVRIVVLEDFGNISEADQNAWAFLVDSRAIRLHPSQTEADSDRNGLGGFTNHYLKENYTGHFSKVVNAMVFTVA